MRTGAEGSIGRGMALAIPSPPAYPREFRSAECETQRPRRPRDGDRAQAEQRCDLRDAKAVCGLFSCVN
uniref:Uncharacterized protein n=1 Tax=Oryza nivara TaxID=4536 RepID=A0A0E0FM45_ORYNI